jgi:proteasome assembly chaperone 3
MEDSIKPDAFPVQSKQVAGSINGVPYDLSSMYFSDKIIVTISQDGRLSQWVCCRKIHHNLYYYV